MSIAFDYDSTYPGPSFPVAEITIVGDARQQVNVQKALIDTGADATIVPLNILESIGARRIDNRVARN